MGLRILLAGPCNSTYMQLQRLIKVFSGVESVDRVATEEEMKNYLRAYLVDFVIVHQALIQNFPVLPRNRFLVIADKIDKEMLLAIRDHGGRGYLLEKTAQDMIQLIINIAEQKKERLFLLEPSLSLEVLNALDDKKFLAPAPIAHLDLLTPQEKQVLYLIHVSQEVILL